ncbi:HET-domain-containing protein [Xylaria cubensis]|nr:HET-domain-containing protein [Xylaria cubensis]
MALCQRCDEFDIQSLFKPGWTLKLAPGDVKAASGAGCEFCSLLYYYVKDKLEEAKSSHGGVFRGPWYIQLSTYDPLVSQRIAHDPNMLQIDRLYVSIVPRVYPDFFGFSSGPRVPEQGPLVVAADTGSPAAKSGDVRSYRRDTMGNITEWLASCLQHPKCRETASGSQFDVSNQPLPTRCIFIEPNSGGNAVFRLCETESQRGSYVTLSHRWTGQTELTRTTTSNYDKRKDGDFGFLPAVFVDAMEVVLSQGIQYIWIDSLCIIQEGDGGTDWGKESLRMADYYQHAVFTIMSAVTSPFDGLFRPQSYRQLVRLPYRDKHGCRSGYFFVFRHGYFNAYIDMAFSDIYDRGWIFQEWVLSRRLVNFTDKGIIFTCRSSLPLYEDLNVIDIGLSGTLGPFTQLRTIFCSGTPAGELWCRLINRYARLRLTKKEDRLVAVAGIADEYRRILVTQNITDLRYIAGLWMWDIHQGLLWHRTSKGATRLPTEPSWSWTCSLSFVDWLKVKRMPRKECTITLCQEVESDQQLGRQELRLAICGKLLPVVIRQKISWHEDSACAIREMTKFEFLSTVAGTLREPSFWAVCSISKPDLIAGWGSFEEEKSIQGRLGSSAGICVFALLVRTRYANGNYRNALGRTSLYVPVYDVLYLDPTPNGENEYYRVGAGCLFEPGLLKEFLPLSATDITLV